MGWRLVVKDVMAWRVVVKNVVTWRMMVEDVVTGKVTIKEAMTWRMVVKDVVTWRVVVKDVVTGRVVVKDVVTWRVVGGKGCEDLENYGKSNADESVNLKSGDKERGNEKTAGDNQTSQGDGCSDKNARKVYLKVPFIGKRSIMFGKGIKKLMYNVIDNEVVTIYTSNKVNDHFVIKDKTPKPALSKVVYQFQCPGDPGTKYVGFTNRTLNERVREHLKPGTAVFDHIEVCESCQKQGITIKDFKILKKCRSKADTAIYEALLIKRLNPTLNVNLKKPGRTWCLQLFG